MRKTYYCPHCKLEFTGVISVHRVCGTRCGPPDRYKLIDMVTSGRPAYMGNNKVRSADRLMQREFEARNIANYTNATGGSKVEFTGTYGGGSMHGVTQPPITAGWGKDALSQVNQQYGTSFALPEMTHGSIEQTPGRSIPWGQSVPKIPVE